MCETKSFRPRRNAPRAWRSRRGLSLAEVVVSTLLVGLLLTAALTSVGAAARSTLAAAEESEAVALARQLLDEITALPYEDPDQLPEFGLESGETGPAGARTFCDDVDDYRNWDDSPPKDREGTEIPGYTGWKRTAHVEKLHADDHKVMPDSRSDSGLRLVTVAVITPSGKTTTLQAYRVETGGSLQPKGVDQTLITWIGVTLESGAGTPVTSGVSLINHATDR